MRVIEVTQSIQMDQAPTTTLVSACFYGGRHGIRTRDPRLRRPVLYPAELTAHAALNYFFTFRLSDVLTISAYAPACDCINPGDT